MPSRGARCRSAWRSTTRRAFAQSSAALRHSAGPLGISKGSGCRASSTMASAFRCSQFVEREPALEEPGLRVPGVRRTEEPSLRVDRAIDDDVRGFGDRQAEELRDRMEVRRGLGMPDGRDADMHPLPAAQEDEQVVVVEFAVSVENRPGKPPGVAQGESQVVGPIDVPEEPVGPARAVIALLGAFPLQVARRSLARRRSDSGRLRVRVGLRASHSA